MADGNLSPASERSAEERMETFPQEISWIRAIARPATGVEVDDMGDSICRREQHIQIACLALAAG
jgi:hypothetical protein